MLLELDGRPFHDTARARDLDLDRDLDAVLGGRCDQTAGRYLRATG